jgi:hypothetical protein
MIKRSMAADRNVGLAHPQAPARRERLVAMAIMIPPLLRHSHTDEFRAPPWSIRDRRALARVASVTDQAGTLLGLDPHAYVEHRCGTAATLRAIDAEAGGGF